MIYIQEELHSSFKYIRITIAHHFESIRSGFGVGGGGSVNHSFLEVLNQTHLTLFVRNRMEERNYYEYFS